jgi:hypothetical protein
MPTKNDILQTSLTLAGIAVALAAVLPSIALGPSLPIDLGDFHRLIPLVPSTLALCGLFSLSAGIRSLDESRRDQRLSIIDFFRNGGASLSLLMVSMLLLSATYLAVLWEIADKAKVPTP